MGKCHNFLSILCENIKSNSEGDANVENEDSNSQMISENLGKILRIVTYLCKYSADHCVTAISEMKMLDIISIQLKDFQSKPGKNNSLHEILMLLGALIPDSQSCKGDKSDFAQNEKAKSLIFESDDSSENTYKVLLIESILPSMLKIFSVSFDQNIKFALLQLIEEIVLMLSGETLKVYLQPHLFSGFVISTLKSNNYTWIEI